MNKMKKLPVSVDPVPSPFLPPLSTFEGPADAMAMIQELNSMNRELRGIIDTSGNGDRFRMARDLKMRDLANKFVSPDEPTNSSK